MIVWAAQRTGSSTLMNWIYKSDLKYKNISSYNLKYIDKSEFPNLEIFNSNHGYYRNCITNNISLNEIFKQDFCCKIHPEYFDYTFIENVINNSGHHKHLILYRENTFERILSNHYALINRNFDDTLKKEYKVTPIPIDWFIKCEKNNRKKYKFILEKSGADVISYEDIYVRKNIDLLKSIFPNFDVKNLLEKKRYKNHKRYSEIEGISELKKACDKLGDFKF